MDLGKFVSDIKSKTIDPLLEEQAVAHLDGQLKRYQQETGNRLTDADFEEVNKSLHQIKYNQVITLKKL